VKRNKRGIELSVNFLVTIVIAITIFLFGIRFIYNLASEATSLASLTTDELDARIGDLLCESTDRICIGIDKKVIAKGEYGVFGVKIVNVYTDGTDSFEINIEPKTGFTQNNEEIDLLDVNKISIKYRDLVTIERNSEDNVGVGVEVPDDIPAGTYIIDVRVQPYDSLHKLYVEVP